MSDPRVEAYARLLVERSIDPRPGAQVLVSTTTNARPLAEELSRQLARRGAYALTRMSVGGAYPVDAAWIGAAPSELAAGPAPLEQEVVDRVDGLIHVLAPDDPPFDAGFSAAQRRALRAQFMAYRMPGREGRAPEVRCDFPCPWFARQAGLSLAEYEDDFYAACLRDWDAEGARMRPILERFDAAETVRIVGPGTDLTLSLAGRPGAIDDGHVNVPGGEIYFSPVEDSVEGVVRFSFPSGEVSGAWLRLERGEVVESGADSGAERLQAALGTDEGARRFGELGLGCNEGIDRHLRNVLFDEKMAGTIHLALGNGFPLLGGRNRSSLHWDLVTDMHDGGELWCDGELVQQSGRWLL